MNDRIRKRTKNLTICAMLCALGVILMTVGAFIEVLDLSTAALASLLCIFVVIGFIILSVFLMNFISARMEVMRQIKEETEESNKK